MTDAVDAGEVWVRHAYEATNALDFGPIASGMSEDYVHRIPARGIEWVGKQESLAKMQELYTNLHLHQEVVGVHRFERYLILDLRIKSDIYVNGGTAIGVYLMDGDIATEYVGAYPEP